MTPRPYRNWHHQKQCRQAMTSARDPHRRIVLPNGKQMTFRRDPYLIEVSIWNPAAEPEELIGIHRDGKTTWWSVRTKRRRIPDAYERPPVQLSLF